MSRASQVIVLVEDERQRRFACHYLKRLDYSLRNVRSVPLPAGRQSGEQWVREKYATEVRAFRVRQARARTLLIVAIDADTRSVAQRAAQLHQALQSAEMPARAGGEAIVHFIPKHSIETWILALSGSQVTESRSYRDEHGVMDLLRPAISAFHAGLQGPAPPGDWLPSLQVAHEEGGRIPRR